MTSSRNLRIFLLALLLASASAFLAYELMTSRPESVPATVQAAPPAGEPVLVGARSIAAGETISAADIEVAYVAPEAKGVRALTASTQAIDHVALVDIPKGEQILASSVGSSLDPAPKTFARDVPVGMRAVAIALEETVGAGGLVQPGDQVDVIASYEVKPAGSSSSLGALGDLIDLGNLDDLGSDDDEADPFPVAELLLQDVEVLAIGQALDAKTAPPPPSNADASTDTADESAGPAPLPEASSVTLLVNPSEALRLLLAVESEAIFRLLLRAPGDSTLTDLPPAMITNSQVPMAPFSLIGANLAPTDVIITNARFRQTSVPAGGILEFEATVRNVSSQLIPAGRGGAGPGHVYRIGETWQTVEDEAPEGVYSVGVTSEDEELQTYPWRWDLGEDLAPGQTATITGGIQVPNVAGIQRWWLGTMLQPGTVLEDGVASTQITIEPVSSVVVVMPEIDLRESPWPNSKSVLKVSRGTRADVLEYQDGWFLIRFDKSDGWVPESAVTNAELPEAAAAATPVPSS